MKTASASLLLGVCVLLSAITVSAVFVNVSPNRPQFFPGESVTLRCEGAHSADGWTLKRQKLYDDQIQTCGGDFGQFDGFSCIISDLNVRSDSAAYWCENRASQESDKLSIFVSDHVILEIPALPVTAGSSVTLRCRPRYEGYRVYSIDRNRESGSESFPAVHIIHNVQKSDEGIYSCSATHSDMMMVSDESKLTVAAPHPDPTTSSPPPTTERRRRGTSVPPHPDTSSSSTPPPPTTCTLIPPLLDTSSSSPPPPPQSVSMLRVFCHLLVFCPFCISTVLLLSFCYSRNRKSGKEPADSMYDDVTADVTTEHEF